mgnify:CR=1 FL=1
MFRLAALTLAALSIAGCSGGRDALLADLQSARPEVRALAVKRLSEKAAADDVSLFSQAARDPSPLVRAEAMTALGKTQDGRVVDLLGEALGDADDRVQQRAAAALASFKLDKARGYLTLQYSRRGRSTRLAIVEALRGAHIPGAMASVVAAESAAIWDRNVKVLDDGTLPERVGAAEELGRSGRQDAVNRLVPLLKDKHVALAAAAARGLGLAGDVRAVPALTALLDENYPELREAACEALGRLGDPAPLPKLVAIAQEQSPLSAVATRAVLSLPRSPAVDEALCQLVLTASEAEVMSLGRELRRRGGCPVEPLLDKLRSPAATQQVLTALVALAPAGEVAAKVIPLTTVNDDTTRRLAVEVLAEINAPSAAEAVRKAWDAELKALEPRRADWITTALPTTYAPGFDPGKQLDPDDPMQVRRSRTSDLLARVQALDAQRAQASGKTMLKPLVPRELIDDAEDNELRTLAAILRAMGRLKADGTKEAALGFIDEANPQLRGAAYAALASVGEDARAGLFDTERSVQGVTAQALVDAGPTGQLVVLQALTELSGDRSRLLEPLKLITPPAEGAPKLEQLVKEGGLEAGTAARLLGEMGAKGSVPLLLSLLNDPETVARREVLLALGRLGDERAVEVVARDLYSDSAEVRAAACRALAALQPRDQLEAIDALKGDYDRRVRESAQLAVDGQPAAAQDGGAR